MYRYTYVHAGGARERRRAGATASSREDGDGAMKTDGGGKQAWQAPDPCSLDARKAARLSRRRAAPQWLFLPPRALFKRSLIETTCTPESELSSSS